MADHGLAITWGAFKPGRGWKALDLWNEALGFNDKFNDKTVAGGRIEGWDAEATRRRVEAAHQRVEAASERAEAPRQRAEVARHRVADRRERLADIREAEADERERAANEREVESDERERIAGPREAEADEREAQENEREQALGRERLGRTGRPLARQVTVAKVPSSMTAAGRRQHSPARETDAERFRAPARGRCCRIRGR